MTNNVVRAAAEGMPSINRRRAMLGAGATAAALAVTSLPAEPATETDAELFRLAAELDRVRPIYKALNEELQSRQDTWRSELDRRGISVQSDIDNGWSLYHELGINEIEARYDPVADRFVELNVAILEMVPATLAGLAAKARSIRLDCTPGPDDHPLEAEYKEMNWDDEMIIRFTFDVERLAGAVS